MKIDNDFLELDKSSTSFGNLAIAQEIRELRKTIKVATHVMAAAGLSSHMNQTDAEKYAAILWHIAEQENKK